MLVGYARVSTTDQNLDLQKDALTSAGCEKIFTDVISGAKNERPGLSEALLYLRPGDTLVVWRLDRLGRSLRDLIDRVYSFGSQGIGFRTLMEGFDTMTPAGKLFFHMCGALAEFERDLIRERTEAGVAAARARGRRGGRPRTLTPQQIEIAQTLRNSASRSVQDICDMLHISQATYYRHTTPKNQVD